MTTRVLASKGPAKHPVLIEEGLARTYAVRCLAGCTEEDPKHPNRGNPWERAAPGGEEQALRMALDHLSRLGYVPARLPKVRAIPGYPMGIVVSPRNRYE